MRRQSTADVDAASVDVRGVDEGSVGQAVAGQVMMWLTPVSRMWAWGTDDTVVAAASAAAVSRRARPMVAGSDTCVQQRGGGPCH